MKTKVNKLLLVGFNPFGPYKKNVSKEIIKRFHGTIFPLNKKSVVKIIGLILPINYLTFRQILSRGIKEINPKIVVGLGMDFKDYKHLSFELAANKKPIYGNDIVDMRGNLGRNKSLDKLPNLIRIPNEKQIRRLISKIKGVKLSENAGRHMCETVLRDIIRFSNKGIKFQPIFIHLPHTKELAKQSIRLSRHMNYMPLNKQIKVVRGILKDICSFYL